MLRDRSGFTLIEVVVAIALTSIVLVGARHLITQMADSAATITESATQADSDANAERLLRSLAVQLEIGTHEGYDFSGAERETLFTSWCDTPGGWQERCSVRIAIDTTAIGGDRQLSLTARIRPMTGSGASGVVSEMRIIKTGFSHGSLRFLNRPQSGGEWFISWGRGITAPLALGVILEHGARADTIILRIGERG